MSEEKKPSALPLKIRISAIDRFRGLSIFFMIFGHGLLYWLLPQEVFYAGFVVITWETLLCAAGAFIFISGISMSLSYNSYSRMVQASPHNTQQEKWNGRLQIWIRTGWIAGLAFLTNVIGSVATGQLVIWIWFVLQTTWVARAVIYPFLQVRTWYRLVIGLAIILLADPLRIWCLNEMLLSNQSLFFDIFFKEINLNPFFPFVGFFFIGSALGGWLDQWTQIQTRGKNTGQNNRIKIFIIKKLFNPRAVVAFGAIFITISIIIGWQMDYSLVALETVWRINILPGFNIQGIPAFLVHGNSAWGLCTIGFDIVVFALFFNTDVKNLKERYSDDAVPLRKTEINEQNGAETKKTYKNSTKALTLFGQQSLTVYLSHYFVFYIFQNMLWFWQYLILAPLIVVLIHTGIWIWANGWGRGYTLDWVVGKTSDMATKAILQRITRYQEKSKELKKKSPLQ